MRKMLALLLAAAVLYFAPVFLSVKSQTKTQATASSSKFVTVANAIPNRYIVVLSTTDLSPIPNPTPTSLSATPKNAQSSSTASASAPQFAPHSGAMFDVAGQVPADTQVGATATSLTSTHGGSFSKLWSEAVKGFRLHASEAQAISMSQDSRVAFIVQDGAIAVGTPDTDPIAMAPDPNGFLNPQPNASWGLDRIGQRFLPLDKS
jgi:hypothetical protein